MLVDEDLGVASPESLFDRQRWGGAIEPTPHGRGASQFVSDGARSWVWRRFRRGGILGRLVRTRYLFTGEEQVRSFAEWRLLAQLRTLALPVPRPVAARYQRHGPFYTADLMTVRINGTRSLSDRVAARRMSELAWNAVGRCIRTFHDCGVFHADLNAHNILLDTGDDVSIIDFDRGRLRDPNGWQQRNLARLQRSLLKITDGDHDTVDVAWKQLMAGYRDLD